LGLPGDATEFHCSLVGKDTCEPVAGDTSWTCGTGRGCGWITFTAAVAVVVPHGPTARIV
jgi:hypothetical protein